MTYDAVVIGGGVSGLTTALILARNGQRVAVVETSPRTAPVLRGFSRRGVVFDTGFHYAGGLQDGGAFDLLLRYLGLADRLRRRAFDPEGFDVYRCREPEFELAFPCGYERIRERLVEAFPRERPAVEAYLGAVRRICAHLPFLNLDASLRMEALDEDWEVTLAGFLDGITGDPALRAVLTFHCFLHGVPPEEVSLVTHAGVVGPLMEAAHGLVGGGLGLAEAFDAALAENGVDVHCGKGVQEILFSESGAVEGVKLEGGERLFGRACVSTVHPAQLVELVPPGVFRPAFVHRMRELEDTPSAFMLYGVTDRPVAELERCNRYFFPSPDPSWFRDESPLAGRPLYVTAAWTSEPEPSARGFVALCPAPIGASVAWNGSRRGARPAAYDRFKAAATETLRHELEQRWPDLTRRIVHLEAATPLTLRDYAASPNGSLYGVKHSVTQINPQSRTRVPGLYLAGQAVASPGVLGAMISAFLACGNLVGHDELRRAVGAAR
ncbi:MAG: NAD(P)/FAD-dependent oxidoreductase [Deltaproteobacteria bacterium]|nr:NAD(P)/FAD-dependent oxidoreductase [Deltaproteobacteria bacterium]